MMAERGTGELLHTDPPAAPPNSPWRAMTSTSITAQPSCWNTWITELLPEAMPPVRPTRNIFPGKEASENAEPGAGESLE